MRFIFSIVGLCYVLGAFGQRDTTKIKVKPDWEPSLINVGLDVSSLIGNVINSDRSKYEGTIEFDTHKFFVVLEGGTAKYDRTHDFQYTNSGSFFRAGVDYNVLASSPDGNVITIGARYARSNFDDQLTFSQDHYWFGDQDLFYANNNVTAQWFEAVTRLNVRVWKNLYLGSAIRVKMIKRLKGLDNLVPYDIPGWGRHRKSGTDEKLTNAGFSYYLMWRFELRDKPPYPKKD